MKSHSLGQFRKKNVKAKMSKINRKKVDSMLILSENKFIPLVLNLFLEAIVAIISNSFSYCGQDYIEKHKHLLVVFDFIKKVFIQHRRFQIFLVPGVQGTGILMFLRRFPEIFY